MRKRSIGVIGAGIGGLSVALQLARDGNQVVIFDQMKAPRPLGSGLVVQPVGQEILRQLGLWEEIAGLGAVITGISGIECAQNRPVLDVSYGQEKGLGITRGALFDVLWRGALRTGVEMVLGVFVSDVSNGWVKHSKGREGPFDLVIDASGVHSKISPMQAVDLPYGALWTTANWVGDLPQDKLSQVYRRADRMLGILPVGRLPGESQEQAAVFWSLPADGYEAWRAAGLDAWKSEAIGLWPAFAPFLDQVTAPEQMTMARYSHGTLKQVVQDRLVFIGDSAHRTSPQLGQGANMALLDAAVLAAALRQHHSVEEALRVYAMARRWHVRLYQAISMVFTPQYQSDSRVLPMLRDRVLYPVSRIWPVPYLLRQMVSGTVLPPFGAVDITR